MKKKLLNLLVAMCLLCGVMIITDNSVQAKTKNYSIKGTTLTITGNISKDTKFKKADKVTEIVVSKKAKKLYAKPFKNLKKVKTLRIPGSCKSYFCANTIDTVVFTTPIKSNDFFENFKTKKYVVSKKDKKYKSIEGNVYTKDGKKFIAMPSETKNLDIREGCDTVAICGIWYIFDKEKNRCKYAATAIRNIVIPKSVTKYTLSCGYSFKWFKHSDKIKILFKNKKIDGVNLGRLFKFFGVDAFKRMFKDKVQVKENCVIYNNNLLVAYIGCEEVVNIPEGITKVNPHALKHSVVYRFDGYKKINYPSTLNRTHAKLIKSPGWGNECNYNVLELDLDRDKEEYLYKECAYCKHQQGKLAKINIKRSGVLKYDYSYNHKPFKLFNGNKEEIKEICYDKDMKEGYVSVKKGDTVYFQIPKLNKDKELATIINGLEILPNNEAILKTVAGSNKTQYIELNKKQKNRYDLFFSKFGTHKEKINVKLQKYINNRWTDVSKSISGNSYTTSYGLGKGKYRFAINAPINSSISVLIMKEIYWEDKVKTTRNKAFDLDDGYYSYSAFLTDEEGNEMWVKFKLDRTNSIEFQATLKGQNTLEIYKGQNKKPIKKYMNCEKEISLKLKKGTYYIKAKRADRKDFLYLNVDW